MTPRPRSLLAAVAFALGPACLTAHSAAAQAAPAAPAAVGWGLAKAIAAPGLTYARIGSLSCRGTGDCLAGGSGTGSDFTNDAFLAQEKNGIWGAATPVPGLAALTTGYTSVNAVSCASPGNCAAVGEYAAGNGTFVVDEANGVWGRATPLPGINTSSTSGPGPVISCTAGGDCVAIVTCINADEAPEVFIATETGGTWAAAKALPGFAAVGAVSDTTEDNYLSCPSTGDCGLAGTYVNNSGHYISFVAAERNGAWSAARAVTDTQFDTISCPSAGNCVAAGQVEPGGKAGAEAGYVSEQDGTWSQPAETPGLTALKDEEFAGINSTSCPRAGDCAAVGTDYETDGDSAAFVDTETGGRWGRAAPVPGLAALSVQGTAAGLVIGCVSPGNCSVGGYYAYSTYELAFLAQETNRSWASARTVGGVASLGSAGQEAVNAISCAPSGGCGATGVFSPAGKDYLSSFAVSQVTLRPTVTVLALTTGRAAYGDEQTVQAAVAVSAAAGTATGTVTVRSGARIGCTITLSGGAGTCRLTATGFTAGDDRLTAAYGGGIGLAPAVSAPRTLTVVRAATSTRLKLSTSTVTFGDEQAERLTATVSPRYAGTATGRMTIRTGSTTVCVITLKSSRTGHCTLSPKKLGPGSYPLVARYPGSADFTASASAKETLTVAQ